MSNSFFYSGITTRYENEKLAVAAYHVATQTPGVSALELQRKLGINRYETAFQLLHKLRASMVRPGRDKIGAEWPKSVKTSCSDSTSQTLMWGIFE